MEDPKTEDSQELEKTLSQVKEKAGRIRELESLCKELTNQLAAVVERGKPTTAPSEEPEGPDEHTASSTSYEHDRASTREQVCYEEGDRNPRTCQCGCLDQVQQLQRRVDQLEDALAKRDEVIASLKADNRQKTTELLDFQQQKLQVCLSEKDSAIAVLELQPHSDTVVEKLKVERASLTAQLKDKAQQKLGLLRKESDDAISTLQYQGCTKEQVCDVLRTLKLDSTRLKAYIDHLLALVLETNTALLEGMPRIQQSAGIGLDLLAMASLPELVEELHEKEKDSRCLQNYAGLLLRRIMDYAPHLLQTES